MDFLSSWSTFLTFRAFPTGDVTMRRSSEPPANARGGLGAALFRMGRAEVVATTLVASVLMATGLYWMAILTVDGSEGSYDSTPTTRGHCFPPFHIYGLACRQWVAGTSSSLEWHVVLAFATAVTLALAVRWRRSLVAASAAILVAALTFPSWLAGTPSVLLCICIVCAWRRLRRVVIASHDEPV